MNHGFLTGNFSQYIVVITKGEFQMILKEARDFRDYEPYNYGMPDDINAYYTFTVYELLCENCKAHFFIFEGDCCPCCGVDDAVDISETTRELRLDKETGNLELV